jgi:MFS family permease
MAQTSEALPANEPRDFSPDFEKRTFKKVIWRLMPFLFLCYIFAYVDRVNVGFAGLDMKKDLGMNDAAFGGGSGFFFWGYLLFQVPCNVALQKIGAKRWLGPIMIVWGFVSACTMFVHGAFDFYVMRFLLGIVESGFFPGVILYLTFWFTGRYRAQMVAIFMTAIPLSGFIFGPISGWLMKRMNNVAGLHGWQWLFVLEAVPSILAGLASMVFLENGPGSAHWLNTLERELLCQRLAEDEELKKTSVGGHHSFAAALRKPAVWLFCLIYFGSVSGNYALQFWLPQIIKNLSHCAPRRRRRSRTGALGHSRHLRRIRLVRPHHGLCRHSLLFILVLVSPDSLLVRHGRHRGYCADQLHRQFGRMGRPVYRWLHQ